MALDGAVPVSAARSASTCHRAARKPWCPWPLAAVLMRGHLEMLTHAQQRESPGDHGLELGLARRTGRKEEEAPLAWGRDDVEWGKAKWEGLVFAEVRPGHP